MPLAIVMRNALNHELNHKKCFIWWCLICHYRTVVYRIWYEKKNARNARNLTLGGGKNSFFPQYLSWCVSLFCAWFLNLICFCHFQNCLQFWGYGLLVDCFYFFCFGLLTTFFEHNFVRTVSMALFLVSSLVEYLFPSL